MNKATTGALAALATLALATSAQAQICAGYPSSERGFYFGARADFPDNSDSYGVEANYNFSGPLGVYGGLNVISAEDDVEGEDDEGLDEYYAGVALETPSLGLMIGPRVSACPVIEGRIVQFDGLGDFITVPIGFGIGADLGLPIGPSVSGYVQPRLVLSRFSPENDDLDSETDTDFGVKAGAMVGFGLITVGGEVQQIFGNDSDALFGIRVGIRI